MNATNSASTTPTTASSPKGPASVLTRVACDMNPFSETMCAPPVRCEAGVALSTLSSLQVAEHLGARARDGGVGAVVARQRRPAALLDERALLIRADLLQLDHVGRGPRGLLKLVD